MTWEIFGTDHLQNKLLCPCGQWVPHEVAYRDGPRPFHWNDEGGGHTMDFAAWARWAAQNEDLDTPSDWMTFLTDLCGIYIPGTPRWPSGVGDYDPF